MWIPTLLNFGFKKFSTENDNRSPDENAKVCQICKGWETVGHLEKIENLIQYQIFRVSFVIKRPTFSTSNKCQRYFTRGSLGNFLLLKIQAHIIRTLKLQATQLLQRVIINCWLVLVLWKFQIFLRQILVTCNWRRWPQQGWSRGC